MSDATPDQVLVAVADDVFGGDLHKLLGALRGRLEAPPRIHRLDAKLHADIPAVERLIREGVK